MKYLEQKFTTDVKWLKYTRKELEEHDNFMKKFVFPLDEIIRKWEFSPNMKEYNFFILEYGKLSENVKLVLREVYEEYRILYFKKKIENIINKNTFKQDKRSFDLYVNWLNQLIWTEETNTFLIKNKDSIK